MLYCEGICEGSYTTRLVCLPHQFLFASGHNQLMNKGQVDSAILDLKFTSASKCICSIVRTCLWTPFNIRDISLFVKQQLTSVFLLADEFSCLKVSILILNRFNILFLLIRKLQFLFICHTRLLFGCNRVSGWLPQVVKLNVVTAYWNAINYL